ncbi:MAG: LysE family transporter [Sediminibacterium sp. Gen4]|jgi:threonine/homoserine/homoserine lactone efflux protein|uniref:LysE family translocator n=1 Tax=unclassified Sediminibacterium TaxID=2635961 RepID=UPI0015B8DDE2|nr:MULTISPECIES: LysE family transporter [unclassified Sediminibacterium]MBW0165086.1 LysE family transporter [Sediminibacterium sp.]NWK64540.1 LysE family transporter [Sediminibacterium sp. Gen4]
MIAPFLKGILLGLILSISVGPVIFAIIKQSINNGHKAGYLFVAGVSASDISLVLICNFFTSLFNTAISHKTSIAIAGSIFLIAVGIYTLFFKKVHTDEENNIADKKFRKRDYAAIFLSGYFMNTLNPGVFLFWFAWTAAILADSQTAEHPNEYRLIVFGTCLVFVLVSDILKVVLAGKLRSRLTAKNLHYINKLSGLILIGFGIALCWGAISLLKQV